MKKRKLAGEPKEANLYGGKFIKVASLPLKVSEAVKKTGYDSLIKLRLLKVKTGIQLSRDGFPFCFYTYLSQFLHFFLNCQHAGKRKKRCSE